MRLALVFLDVPEHVGPRLAILEEGESDLAAHIAVRQNVEFLLDEFPQ